MLKPSELILIICVVVPTVGALSWSRWPREGQRRVYPLSSYLTMAGIGVAITLVGAWVHSAFDVWGGFVVVALALGSYLTRPTNEVS